MNELNEIKAGDKDKTLANFERNANLFDNFENNNSEGEDDYGDSNDEEENYNEDDIEEGDN